MQPNTHCPLGRSLYFRLDWGSGADLCGIAVLHPSKQIPWEKCILQQFPPLISPSFPLSASHCFPAWGTASLMIFLVLATGVHLLIVIRLCGLGKKFQVNPYSLFPFQSIKNGGSKEADQTCVSKGPGCRDVFLLQILILWINTV